MPPIVVPAPDEQLRKAGCWNSTLLEGIVGMFDGALGGTVAVGVVAVAVGVVAVAAACNSAPDTAGVAVELAPTSGAAVAVSVVDSVELPSAVVNC